MTNTHSFYKDYRLPDLETERLLLRPMTEKDAPDVVRWRNIPRIATVSESQVGGSMITLESHLAWFRRTRNTRIDYVLTLKESKQPIGVWNLKEYSNEMFKNAMELGRLIGEEWALGKGYAKEATILWIKFAFEYLSLETIISKSEITNIIPQKINKELGFEYFAETEHQDKKWITLILTKEKNSRLVNSGGAKA